MNHLNSLFAMNARTAGTALGLCLLTVASGRAFAQNSIGVVESAKGQWRDTTRTRDLKPSSQVYSNTVIKNLSHHSGDILRIRFDHFDDQGERGTYRCSDGTTCRQPICPNDIYKQHVDELNRKSLWDGLKRIVLGFVEPSSQGYFQTLSPLTKGRAQQRSMAVLYTDGRQVNAAELFDLWQKQGLSSEWAVRDAWQLEWTSLSETGEVHLSAEPIKAPVMTGSEAVPTTLSAPASGPGLYFVLLDFGDGEGGAVRSGYRMPVLILPLEKKSTAEPRWAELKNMAADISDQIERERYLVAGLIQMKEQLIP
jgi:hypothetical protein